MLVVAWGLLAAGSLVHALQNADDTSTEAAPPTLADRDGTKQGPIPPPLDPETGRSGDGGDRRHGTTIPVRVEQGSSATQSFDAPETWPSIIRPAIVATVVGDGIAACLCIVEND